MIARHSDIEFQVFFIKTLFNQPRCSCRGIWQNGGMLGKIGIGLEYALKRSGPMSMAPSQFGLFTKSDPALETPNLEYHWLSNCSPSSAQGSTMLHI